MNPDNTLNGSFLALKQSAVSLFDPIKEAFPKLVEATTQEPWFNSTAHEGQDERISHLAKESFKLLAKVLLIGALIYTVAFTLEIIKVTLVGVVFSSIIYSIGSNKEYMDKLAAKYNEFWGNKDHVAPEVVLGSKVAVNDTKSDISSDVSVK